MRIAKATLTSASPYSQSRYHEEPKLKDGKELDGDYDRRTWRFHCHCDEEGNVFIPPMQFKLALEGAARYLSEKIPGKGQATWTKHFTAGVMVVDPLFLAGVTRDGVAGETYMMSPTGQKGSYATKRVPRCYPVVQEWKGEVEFLILDDLITPEIFLKTLEAAGKLVGIGRFRPINGGFYGRFMPEGVDWREE